MLFRTLEGKITKIDKSDFLTDKQYYSKICDCYKKLEVKPTVDSKKNSSNTKFINNNYISSKYSRILFNIHNKYSDLIDKVPSYSLRKLLSPYHQKKIVGFTNFIKIAQDEIDKCK